MAKDPAFLFYPADASEDTQFMNRLERGAYFDILKAQKRFGKFTIDQIKKVLGSDFESCWGSISLVLKNDGDFYFIEWVADKIEERKKFSESRRNNRRSKSLDEDMIKTSISLDKDMVIEDEIINTVEKEEKGVQGEKRFNTMPLPADAGDLPDIKINSCIELLKITKQVTVEFTQVQKLWPVFLAQNVNGTKYYANVEAIHSHFINWIKTQKFESSTKLTGTPRQNGQALARQRLREQGAALFNAAAREADNRA